MLATLLLTVTLASTVAAHAVAPSVVSVTPVVSSSVHSSDGYVYYTVVYHNEEYIYTYSTCSPPPASIEVCLSTVLATIETSLRRIAGILASNEVTLASEMRSEHAALTDEISLMTLVSGIAGSLSSAVDVDYNAVVNQVNALNDEKNAINQAFQDAMANLQQLEADIGQIGQEEDAVRAKYLSVKAKKWSLYKAISYIVYEKEIIAKEEGDIEAVVNSLNAQMQAIASKLAQLNRRQEWLESWEGKLYVDIDALQSDIVEFRAVQGDLYDREVDLANEQAVLQSKVDAAESCLESLQAQYAEVDKQLQAIYAYEAQLRKVQLSVKLEASEFTSAYGEFTCEESLLYYEACVSSAVPAVAAPPASTVPAVVASKP